MDPLFIRRHLFLLVDRKEGASDIKLAADRLQVLIEGGEVQAQTDYVWMQPRIGCFALSQDFLGGFAKIDEFELHRSNHRRSALHPPERVAFANSRAPPTTGVSRSRANASPRRPGHTRTQPRSSCPWLTTWLSTPPKWTHVIWATRRSIPRKAASTEAGSPPISSAPFISTTSLSNTTSLMGRRKVTLYY